MKFKHFFFLLFVALNTQGQNHRMYYTDVDFRETQADTFAGKLNSILLVGIGSSLERIFLDDLSEKLIEDFSSKKITASYSYLSKNLKEAQKNFNDSNINKYKAVLFFYPTGTTLFENRYIRSNIFIPLLVSPIILRPGRHRDTYEQSFQISLYKTTDSLTRVWNANVDIDCEPGKKKGAKKLGNKILKQFIINKYI